MNRLAKPIIKRILPRALLLKAWNAYVTARARKAKELFEAAPETPAWLDPGLLGPLQQRYRRRFEYGYDPTSLERRGRERARQVLSAIPGREPTRAFLELACLDGMTNLFLRRKGKMTAAIDIRSSGFDQRARREGVGFCRMDAGHLGFGGETFDLIFSYNSFEHFAGPETVLNETIRVTKTGGYIYLNFGPLYMSPLGLHAYRAITFPYCQFLFPVSVLEDFASSHALGKVPYDELNGWSLEDYRRLWSKYSNCLQTVRYLERYDPMGIELIAKYPSCFKSKTRCFQNLLVSGIEVLFRKKQPCAL